MAVKVGDVGIRRLKAYAEVMFVKRMASAWTSPEVLEGKRKHDHDHMDMNTSMSMSQVIFIMSS